MVAIRYACRRRPCGRCCLANAIVGLFAFNFGNFFATMSTLVFQQPSLYGIGASLNGMAAVLAGLFAGALPPDAHGANGGLSCMALGGALTWIALAPTPLFYLIGMPFFGFPLSLTAQWPNRWSRSSPPARWWGG